MSIRTWLVSGVGLRRWCILCADDAVEDALAHALTPELAKHAVQTSQQFVNASYRLGGIEQ
jgi:hypothetical protein